jgi:hypothetical protein
MQTSRYYRDYAKRARRLLDSMDRRAILETLDTLARGFDEIAAELETGMVAAAPPEQRHALAARNDQYATRH